MRSDDFNMWLETCKARPSLASITKRVIDNGSMGVVTMDKNGTRTISGYHIAAPIGYPLGTPIVFSLPSKKEEKGTGLVFYPAPQPPADIAQQLHQATLRPKREDKRAALEQVVPIVPLAFGAAQPTTAAAKATGFRVLDRQVSWKAGTASASSRDGSDGEESGKPFRSSTLRLSPGLHLMLGMEGSGKDAFLDSLAFWNPDVVGLEMDEPTYPHALSDARYRIAELAAAYARGVIDDDVVVINSMSEIFQMGGPLGPGGLPRLAAELLLSINAWAARSRVVVFGTAVLSTTPQFLGDYIRPIEGRIAGIYKPKGVVPRDYDNISIPTLEIEAVRRWPLSLERRGQELLLPLVPDSWYSWLKLTTASRSQAVSGVTQHGPRTIGNDPTVHLASSVKMLDADQDLPEIEN